jgi:hypothetical protein
LAQQIREKVVIERRKREGQTGEVHREGEAEADENAAKP